MNKIKTLLVIIGISFLAFISTVTPGSPTDTTVPAEAAAQSCLSKIRYSNGLIVYYVHNCYGGGWHEVYRGCWFTGARRRLCP